jgi:predicted DNA binding CopG/RHH family protein
MRTTITKKEEQELVASVERGEWKPVKDMEKEIARHRLIARETMKKDQRINVRLTQHDLVNLKAKAAHEGIPYQTLVASIIHKFVSGQMA